MFKTTKAKIIFVAVFSIICITVTTLLVLYKKIDITETTDIPIEEQTTIKEKDFPGIDLNGTYDENNLKIEEVIATKEKVESRYIKISGLKNKEIENKINKEIEEVALNFYKEKIKDLNEVVNVSIDTYCIANFANTLSIRTYYFASKSDGSEDFYQETKNLSYNLVTGEKIILDDLFTSDAPVENILRKSAYYSIVQYNVEDSLTGEFVVREYGDIEDEVAEFINLYKKGNITEFAYTPRYIYIRYKNFDISIDMKEYYEYIAIYNRFTTSESIYESNDIGYKNMYTLSSRYRDVHYYENYQKEDNYYIEISIDWYDDDNKKTDFTKKLVSDKIQSIEAEIKKVKQEASKNKNNFYILNYYIYVSTIEDWQTKEVYTHYSESGNTYEMTVHDFEENIEPQVVEYWRNAFEGGEVPSYIYDFSETLKIAPQETLEYYNPETGEKIVI